MTTTDRLIVSSSFGFIERRYYHPESESSIPGLIYGGAVGLLQEGINQVMLNTRMIGLSQESSDKLCWAASHLVASDLLTACTDLVNGEPAMHVAVKVGQRVLYQGLFLVGAYAWTWGVNYVSPQLPPGIRPEH